MRWYNMNDVDFEPKLQEFSYRFAGLDDLELVSDLLCKIYYKSKRYIKEKCVALLKEIRVQLATDTQSMFLAYDGDKPVGLSYVSLRHEHVEGAESSPVGYLEAAFVEPDYRRKYIGCELVFKCSKWAVRCGYSEFARDCGLDNSDSYKFHMRVGFNEVSRNIHFINDLRYTMVEMNEEIENCEGEGKL